MKPCLFFLSVLVLFSCRKSDLTPPTVSSVTVNNVSGETLQFSPGESFTLEAFIQDNVELGQFKIDIHQDFDGHSHKSTTVRYAEIRIKDIEGTSYNLEEVFNIPQNASSGTYHGTIQALDAEGNVSDIVLFYFDIVRPSEQPIIVMDLPETIAVGSTLNILGVVTAQDDATLSTLRIRIRSTKTGNRIHNETYNIPSGLVTWNTFTDGNIAIQIPAEEDEKLIFRLWVEDSNGNNTIFEAEIIIV